MYKFYEINAKDVKNVTDLANNDAHMISLVYKYVFGIDLNSLDTNIDAKHYRISKKLALYLLDWAKNNLDVNISEMHMLWLQLGPSARDHLDFYEIEIYSPKAVYQ